MNSSVRIRLSALMFLEFFIWGAWYVTLGTYLDKVLHATGIEIGAAYSAMAVATIFSPFFVGMIADRFFPAQRVLGVLHLAGAALLYSITTVSSPGVFYWIVLLYSLMYAPTLALANSVAFRQMKDPGKEFASIRVLGTIGWILTGWLLDKVFHISETELAFTFKMAATASLVLGLLSFFLPNTPPKGKGTAVTFRQILGADAFVLFKDRSFMIFFIASVLICIPLSFYYSLTNLFLTEAGMKNATSNMTFGQFSEALFILLIPFLFRKLGVKWMIAVGMIAWSVRFLFFSYGDAQANLWMLFAGIISGLLGIGSGALKVVAMDTIMRIPFKVSTTTSNFMIGVTASASAVVYLQRGYISPGLSMPVVIGVLLGALTGSKILVNSTSSRWLRWVFAIVVTFLAGQMIYNGIAGKI